MGALLVTLLLVPRPVLSGAELHVDTVDGAFKVHYTLAGADAPVHAADTSPPNGVPDDVDALVAGLAEVRHHWVDVAGMRAPLPDDGTGGDARIDVYLRKLDGPRGYAHPEAAGVPTSNPSSAWIELEPRTALVGASRLSAAAGHEAHHAIQYAYTATPDSWIAEATAAYVENADFAGDAALAAETDAHWGQFLLHPEVALDTADGRREYDALVFVKFLVDAGGGDAVLHALWSRVGSGGSGVAALAEYARPETLGSLLYRFAWWNTTACSAGHAHDRYAAPARCAVHQNVRVVGIGVLPWVGSVAVAPLGIAYVALPLPDDCGTAAGTLSASGDLWFGTAPAAGGDRLPATLRYAVADAPARPFVLVLARGVPGAPPDGGADGEASVHVELREDAPLPCAADLSGSTDGGAEAPTTPKGCGCALGGGRASGRGVGGATVGFGVFLVAAALIRVRTSRRRRAARRGDPAPA